MDTVYAKIPKRKRSQISNEQNKPIKSSQRRVTSGKKTLDDIMIKIPYNDHTRIGHHFFPNFNACQQPVNDLSELQDFPNITVSMPHPVYVAPKHCDPTDICHRRTMAQSTYSKRLHSARSMYQFAMKKRKNRINEKKGIYLPCLLDFAERLETNPDPFFNSTFDYYYAGGNLCTLPNNHNVVHTAGDGLKDIIISSFSDNEDIIKTPMRQLCNKTLGNSSEILQVSPFLTTNDDPANCFVTRERTSVTIHSFNDENEVKGLTQYNSGCTPFISFAQSAGNLNKFIITNMKQNVRLFDINSSKSTLSKVYDVGSMSWNVVKPWSEHTFLYANCNELMLMDTRTNPTEWHKNKCVFTMNVLMCEEIASLALSKFKNQFYVGGSHMLYCLDTRCWGNHFEGQGTVCRWTHMLEYPPLFITTFRGEDSEYVALSGPLANDFRICELQRDGSVTENSNQYSKSSDTHSKREYIYKSLSLPYQPTTLEEAYHAARSRGKCLRPEADLSRRLKFCTTGLAFYENAQNEHNPTLILSSNSIGDVFAYKLGVRQTQDHVPRTSPMTDLVMSSYEEKICAIEPPPLYYTHITSLKAMSKVFRCEKLDYKNSDEPVAPDDNINENVDDSKKDKTFRRNRLGRWQKSIAALHSYKDVLAKQILSIWDVECEEEKDINLSELTKEERTKPASHDLVNDWLNQTAKPKEEPMISIPMSVITESLRKDASEIPESCLNDSVDWGFSQSAKELPQSTQLMDTLTISKQLDDDDDNEDLTKPNILNADLNLTRTNDTTLTATQPSPAEKRQTRESKRRQSYVKGF